MAVTDVVREIDQLNILAQEQLKAALETIKKQGVNPLVLETKRSKERQAWLYAQGRTRPGNIVTWTMNSIHITGFAVDLVAQRVIGGKSTAIWDAKDKDNVKIQKIMSSYGFECGANWKDSPDSPHFQIKGVEGALYTPDNTNAYISKMVQYCLNCKLEGKVKLAVDGDWGKVTSTALNLWRKSQKWDETGALGHIALRELLKAI